MDQLKPESTESTDFLLRLTAEIVSAQVGHSHVLNGDIPALIGSVHGALASLRTGGTSSESPKAEPAVSPKKSIHDDYIICLEDGKKFKSLKRHLMTHYGLTPDQYRKKWGLDSDYPMVSPNYAQARSQLAKKMGLGRKGQPSSNLQ